MSNFVEKIGEKLHMGGHKKDEEQYKHEGGYGEHGAGHIGGVGDVGHGGYGEHGGAHPEHVGGLHGADYGQHGGYGDQGGYGAPATVPLDVGEAGYGQHVGGEHGHAHGTAAEAAGYGVHQEAVPHHEGPVQKVKNKIKGKKEGGGDDSSSSSSSESDGEGGRRKKKHGLF